MDRVQNILDQIAALSNDDQLHILTALDSKLTTKRNEMVGLYGGEPVKSFAAICAPNKVHALDAAEWHRQLMVATGPEGLEPIPFPNIYDGMVDLEAVSDDAQDILQSQAQAERNKALGI